MLLAGERSGLATSNTLSIPPSQKAHSPPHPQQLREAVPLQALAPSRRVVSLPHLEFKADDTTSSHRDRTAEAPAQKLNLFSKPSVHSKKSAGVPQEIVDLPGRTRAAGLRPAPRPLGKCPEELLAIGVRRSSGPPSGGEELNRV